MSCVPQTRSCLANESCSVDRPAVPDPIRPLGLLQSGRTLRRRTCEFRIYEVAIRGLVQSVMTRRWQFFPKADVELDRAPVSSHTSGCATF